MGHNILELDASKPCLGNTHNFLFRVFPDMRATRVRPFAVARLGGEKSGKHDSKPSPKISTGKGDSKCKHADSSIRAVTAGETGARS